MAEIARQVRVFVSSPGDARFERSRLDRVVERLNGEFQGVARLTTIRWETEFYKAHENFQAQIPEAAQCDIVVAIFRSRLGTELPPDFPPMPDGRPYPSGTAYEVLSAIDACKGRGLPDVYVFRHPQPPLVQLEDPGRAEIEAQWERLKGFFETWFKTPEGQFKAAFQTFASTDDFEAQAEALLRKWLEEKVLRGRSLTWPVDLKGSPFRGLAAFGAKHAPVFFGRSRDIAKATDRLKDAAEKNCPFLLVIGASGAGKSSLVRAGLVLRLAAAGVVPSIDVWRAAVMRPGEASGDPFAALARALFVRAEDLPDNEQGCPPALPELSTGDFKDPQELAALLDHADDTALRPIVGTLTSIEHAVREKDGYDRDVKAALLLVVDQLDELFDAQVADDVRARFAKLLGLLARSGRVWIIATLRADLFDRILDQPALKQLKEDGASYDLAPPDMAELGEIVRGPAAAADLIYETDSASGERLDERLLKDADRPDLLPLLQFTLNQLFEARTAFGHETRLTFAAYRALGGLEGAVDKEAESALKALGEAERARLPRLLRELAAPAADGGVGAARAAFDIRSVPLANAAHDETSGRLVRALVDARILLSSGEGSQATVRLAHARVLDSWQRAKTIVTENADFYRIRAEVEDQRRRWEVAHRSRDFLVGRGRPLAEAESISRQFPEELQPATRDFIEASRRRDRLRQHLITAAALVFAVIAAAASVLGILAYRSGQRAEQALATTTRIANTLVFDVGKDPRVHGLPPVLLRQMFDRAIQGYDQAIKLNPNADAYNGRGTAYGGKGDLDLAIADFARAIMLNPKYALPYNNRCNAYLEKGDLDRAIADCSQAIILDPKYSAAYNNRGNAYSDKGDLDDAIADYDQAIMFDPKFAVAYNGRGNVYHDKGELDRAIADFNQAIVLDPKYAPPYDGRGNAYRAKGDLDHAIADYDQAIVLDPINPEAHSNRGNVYVDKGDLDHAIADYDQAIAELERATTREPKKEAIVCNNRGRAYSKKHDLDHAIADYDQAIALNPKYAGAYFSRGNAYRDKGDRDHAIADYSQAIALDPKNADVHIDRGNTYRAKGDLDRAIADYDEAIAINPKYAFFYRNRGLAYGAKGDRDHAIADYSQAITLDPKYVLAYNDRGNTYRAKGDFDHAIADFDQAIALDPKYLYAFYNRGRAYGAKGDRDRAIADFDQAITLDPKYVYAYNDRGVAYRAKGDFDHAIADFDRAIAIDPKNVYAFYNRGLAYGAKGDREQAIADYSQAITLDPKYAFAYNDRGVAYRAKGDIDHAIADFDQVIALDPKNVYAFYNRGLAYGDKGDRDHAIADYSQAITLDPKYVFAYRNRGLAYNDKGDFDHAIADYSQAIALDPKYVYAYNDRGNTYRAKGDFDHAIADFNQAIALDPKYVLAYNNRGFAYYDKGDLDHAIADYSQAITLDPKYTVAYGNRGLAYSAKGDLDHAIADYSRAIALDPKYSDAYYNRGLAYFYGGSFIKAQADFRQTNELVPKYAYAALWLDIAERRSNSPSDLAQAATHLDMKAWPAAVIRLFLGELGPAQTFAAADDSDPKTKQNRVCEVNFYSGELELLHGAKDAAARLFRLAASDCQHAFVEWRGANAELKALAAGR